MGFAARCLADSRDAKHTAASQQRIAKMRERKTAGGGEALAQEEKAQERRAPASRKKRLTGWEKVQLGLALLTLCCALVANPPVLRFLGVLASPCLGTCSVDVAAQADSLCPAEDPARVVYVRVPKTGSSTLMTYARQMHQTKGGFGLSEVREWEDAVPTLGVKPGQAADKRRRFTYFMEVANAVMYPTYEGYNRTWLNGHVFHFDWSQAMNLPEMNYVKYVPEWVWRFLHKSKPTLEELRAIREVSVMRKPQERLKSMYYYDRHGARNRIWRESFVAARGNVTLSECLVDPECVEVNELRRWCSLQTEFLCGFGEDCTRPLTAKAVAAAKVNIESSFVLVGTTERMRDTLALLEKRLPTYFQDATKLPDIVKLSYKHTHRDGEDAPFAAQAQAVLDDLCALDNELYDFVAKRLDQQLADCGVAPPSIG